jgi:hypothetical protein
MSHLLWRLFQATGMAMVVVATAVMVDMATVRNDFIRVFFASSMNTTR